MINTKDVKFITGDVSATKGSVIEVDATKGRIFLRLDGSEWYGPVSEEEVKQLNSIFRRLLRLKLMSLKMTRDYAEGVTWTGWQDDSAIFFVTIDRDLSNVPEPVRSISYTARYMKSKDYKANKAFQKEAEEKAMAQCRKWIENVKETGYWEKPIICKN